MLDEAWLFILLNLRHNNGTKERGSGQRRICVVEAHKEQGEHTRETIGVCVCRVQLIARSSRTSL